MALFNRDDEGKAGATETIIGSSVKVEGKFTGQGNVVIEGKVVGGLKTTGDVLIAERAVVHASVEGKQCIIAGEVRGNVKARERLELQATARVTGDVEAKVIAIDAGAQLNGKCVMVADGVDEQEARAKQQKRHELPQLAPQSTAKR